MTNLLFQPKDAPVGSRLVRLATLQDLAFVQDQQRAWSSQVGFMPTQVFERYILANQIAICEENGWPAGYVSWCGTSKGILRFLQIAVHHDLLRDRIGTDLMALMLPTAAKFKLSVVRLTSRSDLLANRFWPTLGFFPTAIMERNTTRGLRLIEWTRPLVMCDDEASITLPYPKLPPPEPKPRSVPLDGLTSLIFAGA